MRYLMYWNETKQEYENAENYAVAQPERNYAIVPTARPEIGEYRTMYGDEEEPTSFWDKKIKVDPFTGTIIKAILTIEKEIAYYFLLFFIAFLWGEEGRDIADRIQAKRFGESYFSPDRGEDE
jgi:hypothetical protein